MQVDRTRLVVFRTGLVSASNGREGPHQDSRLVSGLLPLALRVGIVHDAGTCLGVSAPVDREDRPDDDRHVEARLLDSESGELIGAVIRQLEGKDLKGKKDMLTLEDMQESLDELTDDASNGLSAALQAGAE